MAYPSIVNLIDLVNGLTGLGCGDNATDGTFYERMARNTD